MISTHRDHDLSYYYTWYSDCWSYAFVSGQFAAIEQLIDWKPIKHSGTDFNDMLNQI
jgi:hypothetical protein